MLESWQLGAGGNLFYPLQDYPRRLLARFEQVFPTSTPQVIVQAPDRRMWAAASLNGTAHFRIYTAESSARTIFSYQSAKRKQTIYRQPLPRWARYIAGISVLLDVPDMPGIDAVACGDEPAGPRYEYALGILFAALWYEINMQSCSPIQLQEIAERVRRDYVGE